MSNHPTDSSEELRDCGCKGLQMCHLCAASEGAKDAREAMSRVRASLLQPTAGSTVEVDACRDCGRTRKAHETLGWECNRFQPRASTPAQSVLVEALHKISNPFDHGHCGTCGKECAGATDCDCSFPVWEQDNPIAIAKAALSHVGGDRE